MAARHSSGCDGLVVRQARRPAFAGAREVVADTSGLLACRHPVDDG
jgi:hypothetical protein